MKALFLYLPIYMFEMIIEYIFFSNIFEQKEKIKIRLIPVFLLFVCADLFITGISDYPILNKFVLIMISVIFSFLCFRQSTAKRLIYTLSFHGVSMMSEILTLCFIAKLFIPAERINDTSPYVLVVIGCISRCVVFLCVLIFLYFYGRKKELQRVSPSFVVYALAVLIEITVYFYSPLRYMIFSNQRMTFALVSIAMLGTALLFFLIHQQTLKKESKYIMTKAELGRLKTEKTYFDILEHQNNQLLLYAHDTKNHLEAIKNLNTDPKIDEYLTKLSSEISAYGKTPHSANKMLNVIINKYITVCEMESIDFRFDIRLRDLGYVSDYDLVTVLGNLLDNAVEAAKASEGKYVRFETDFRNSYDLIFVYNSCDTAPLSEDSELVTSKNDKYLHGLGTKNILKAVKKYGGDFEWRYFEDKKEFVATVMLREK